MIRAFAISSLVLAGTVAGLWFRVLDGITQDSVEVPNLGDHRDFINGRSKTPFQLLLLSDSRGIVFDVFIPQLPPEKAPGPSGSPETQRWLQPRADRTAAAYVRRFGFEKGIEYRHGQYLNDPLYFFGIDYYFAVPHLLLIILGALPALWLLLRYLKDRTAMQSMKLQFSLATLLVCMTVLAVVCAVAAVLPVYEETLGTPAITVENLPDGSTRTIERQDYSESHRPTTFNISTRVTLWGTPALAGTLTALWAIRRLKSRRHTEPPVRQDAKSTHAVNDPS
jgi:hypothetical protein